MSLAGRAGVSPADNHPQISRITQMKKEADPQNRTVSSPAAMRSSSRLPMPV